MVRLLHQGERFFWQMSALKVPGKKLVYAVYGNHPFELEVCAAFSVHRSR